MKYGKKKKSLSSMSGLDGANDSVCEELQDADRSLALGNCSQCFHRNTVHFKVPNTFLRAAMAFFVFLLSLQGPQPVPHFKGNT